LFKAEVYVVGWYVEGVGFEICVGLCNPQKKKKLFAKHAKQVEPHNAILHKSHRLHCTTTLSTKKKISSKMGLTKLIRGYLVSYEKCHILSDNNFLEMKCVQNVRIVPS
jgi:hypothetical protein